jgi:hypothetical protein
MKKTIIAIILALLFVAPNLYAAGSCTQTTDTTIDGFIVQTLACTGDSSNGSIPNTVITMPAIGKYRLVSVSAYPTAGGTAPDAADVYILDADGEDLLGSADNGTTAGKGANLIHATLKKTTLPYSYHSSAWYYPPVTSALTLKVANQATASANYTIKLKFER